MTEYIYEHKPSGADHMGKPVELPTLVQREEIVRCRDCLYFKQTPELGICEQPEFLPLYAEPEGFCSWAKRKEVSEIPKIDEPDSIRNELEDNGLLGGEAE